MFTTFFLQDIFIQELENIFKDDRFPGKNGDKVKLNVFKQFLPIRELIYSEETEGSILDASPLNEENFPYIMVVLLDGTQNTRNKHGITNLLLYFGLKDEDPNRAGYQSALHIIQAICERFEKDIYLSNYQCGENITWELSAEDDHPYYFGAMAMEFKIPAIEKEDNYC